MSLLQGRFPAVLEFDHDPSDKELSQIVGPAITTRRVHWHEDDEGIRINSPPRIPIRAIVVTMVLCFGGITSLPWLLPLFLSTRLPTDDWFVLGSTAAVWLVVIPAVTMLLCSLDRAAVKLGPGAVVSKRTGELQLPWIDRVVQRPRIVRFVDMRGRHRYRNGVVTFYGQYGVLFRDDRDAFIYAPFARMTAPRLRKGCVHRLADFYDLPVQRIKAGWV